jgi:hypothetical protein
MIFLVSNHAAAQDMTQPRAMSVKECFLYALPCSCFNDPAVNKMANGLRERDKFKFELEQYKKFSQESITEKAWYEDSTLYIAGIVTSVIVGSAIGYAVGNK